jgi:hypothetical protein
MRCEIEESGQVWQDCKADLNADALQRVLERRKACIKPWPSVCESCAVVEGREMWNECVFDLTRTELDLLKVLRKDCSGGDGGGGGGGGGITAQDETLSSAEDGILDSALQGMRADSGALVRSTGLPSEMPVQSADSGHYMSSATDDDISFGRKGGTGGAAMSFRLRGQ